VCEVINEAIFYTNNQVPVSSITQRIKKFPALHNGSFLVEGKVQSPLFGFLTLEDDGTDRLCQNVGKEIPLVVG